jgi:ubiquinone/menaquinone biosynthesis C-methylase UbiE
MSLAAQFPVNYWKDTSCARAFWGQQELPPYRQLLADTVAWIDPRPGERWLDLGCGCGQLTRAIWHKSGGRVAEIVGLDCAAANARAYEVLRASVQPPASVRQIRFVHGAFSDRLRRWERNCFDGVVSGLAIQYAESYSTELGRWTTAAYDQVLADVYRVLRPEGVFVFSVNVPEPAWNRLALRSVSGFFQSPRPLKYLLRAWKMWKYGAWLKRQARCGRFHYLPADIVRAKLAAAGFVAIEQRLSFARLAYVFRCRKRPGGLETRE